nr:hypothetical protein [Rhodoferax sp.]
MALITSPVLEVSSMPSPVAPASPSLQRNYGLLDIDNAQVGITLFKSGFKQYSGSINRATWR